MVVDNRTCPVCGMRIESDDPACPRCGFKLAGATQVFTAITDEQSAPDVPTQASPSVLHVIKGPYAGESFQLQYDLISIGRDPSCSIFLNDMTVSREHCKLENRGTHWHLTDCGSLNGTWVNGAIVSEADLYDGASIQVGTFVMVLHMNPRSTQ